MHRKVLHIFQFFLQRKSGQLAKGKGSLFQYMLQVSQIGKRVRVRVRVSQRDCESERFVCSQSSTSPKLYIEKLLECTGKCYIFFNFFLQRKRPVT